jgi:hypothetical protein
VACHELSSGLHRALGVVTHYIFVTGAGLMIWDGLPTLYPVPETETLRAVANALT